MTATPSTPSVVPSRGRWVAGLAIAGVAIALALGAALVLGGRQTPEALRYVPADAVVVAELRLDLPGDQLQKVGNLLAHFPGFADQSTLAGKLDEAGDRLLSSLTEGQVSFTGDLKPWVSGPAVAALRDVGPSRTGSDPTGLAVATTNGAVGCETVFEGRSVRPEAYRDVEIEVLVDGSAACAVDGRHVLVGDPESVRAGLDAHAEGRAIDVTERYGAARAALGGEQLATLFVSGEAAAWLADRRPGAPPLPMGLGTLPDWSIVGIRAEDDALVLDAVTAGLPESTLAPPLAALPAAHSSLLTRHVPRTALVYAELQGVGTGMLNVLAQVRTEPMLAEALSQLDPALAALGGPEQLFGWIEDAGIVVLHTGSSDLAGDVAGGVLLLAPDETTARSRMASYRALLALAAVGGAIELETTMIEGVEVTTVTSSDGSGLPSRQPIQVSFAAVGRLVVIATTERAVALILATDAPGSLTESEQFAHASAHSLQNPRARLHMSVAGGVSYGRHLMSGRQAATFETDVLPYLAPITAIHLTATEGPDGVRARIVMTVSDPQD